MTRLLRLPSPLHPPSLNPFSLSVTGAVYAKSLVGRSAHPRPTAKEKSHFFNLIVVTNGIYGCDTWNLTRKQIHDLESIQLRLLKKVCGVRAGSRASYQDVMKIAERAGCPVVPLGCTIAKLQLRVFWSCGTDWEF
jgi:hypothetical protein